MTRWQNEGAFLLIRDLTVSVFAFALVFPGVDEECMLLKINCEAQGKGKDRVRQGWVTSLNI